MKDRQELARYFKDLGFKLGAEIGVLAGGYSIALCRANPELKLYCIDSWGIGEHRYRDYHLRQFEKAKRRLARYNCTLVRKLSMDAVLDFKKCTLDFVYIDAKHEFDYVMQDIIEWKRRVRPGGIVAGHDYQKPCVKVAVDTYTSQHAISLQLTEDNNWYFQV